MGRGRGVDLTTEETLTLLREVYAKKMLTLHRVARNKTTLTKLLINLVQTVILLQSLMVKAHITAVRLRKHFNMHYNKNAVMSRVGGELSKQEELLSMMREEKQEDLAQRNKRKLEESAVKKRNLESRQRFIAKATSSAIIIDDENTEDVIDVELSDSRNTPNKKDVAPCQPVNDTKVSWTVLEIYSRKAVMPQAFRGKET